MTLGRLLGVCVVLALALGATVKADAQSRVRRPLPPTLEVKLLRQTPPAGVSCGQSANTTWQACRRMARCDARRVEADVVTALFDAIEQRATRHAAALCTRASCAPHRTRNGENHFSCAGTTRLCLTLDVVTTCLARHEPATPGREAERAPRRTRPAPREDERPSRTRPAERDDERPLRARPSDAARPAPTLDGDPFEPASGAVVARDARPARGATPFLFPGHAEGLSSGEYWYWKAPDGHGAGSQKYAYDLTTARWDEASGTWSECVAGREGDAKCQYCSQAERNADCLAYGEPLHAMAAGRVVRCWRNAPENPRPGERHPARDLDPPRIAGGGNRLVVDHGNGTYALYAHMQPGSIPPALCPHEAELMNDANDTDEAAVPEEQQARVEAGQFLGRVGNSGKSGNPHVHVHVQDGPTKNSNGVPLDFSGTWIADAVKPESLAWSRLDGRTRPSETSVLWPDFSKNLPEIAYHGVRDDAYQRLFDHAGGSGYQLEWIDGFELRGRVFFNVIFRPQSAKWAAVHSLTGAQYQAEYERRQRDGFKLRHVDAYTWRGDARYAAIFVQDAGAQVAAYHGRSADEHQRLFEQWSSEGFCARNVSVVSIDGQRRYTALYEKGCPGVRLKSALTPAEYQEEYESNRDGGLHLAYVDAYVHQGRVFYSALWSRAGGGAIVARHGLTGAQYQEQWEDARRAGKLTRATSGVEVDGRAAYVAFWR